MPDESPIDRMRDENGVIMPDRARAFARTMTLTNRENGTASDDVVELAEVVVPEMAERIIRLEQELESREADQIVSQFKNDKVTKVERVLQNLKIDVQDANITFTVLTNKDPIVIHSKVPPEDWMKVPELSMVVSRINEAIS